MRFINGIFTATIGHRLDNATLWPAFQRYVRALPLESGEREKLGSFVHFCLVGERSRYMYAHDLDDVSDFASRAALFQAGAEEALGKLVAQIEPAVESAGIRFDAVVTTTSTGNLMPGLSYRMAHRLGDRVRRDSLLVDLGNVGCTGACKALNLVRSLQESFENVLVVSVEVPTTLLDTLSVRADVWLGNCTFGDGAAALWITSTPGAGTMALALDDMRYWQRGDVGLDLIHWDYGRYYTFGMEDEASFNRQVRDHVSEALAAVGGDWRDNTQWAIHPAGISLLMRVCRSLGISGDAVKPSVDHYRRFSNMSSASIIHILKEVAAAAAIGSVIHLLTMGAGFNVIYGRLRKEA
jgi:alkylresorcinol/alkylpyrone synthase